LVGLTSPVCRPEFALCRPLITGALCLSCPGRREKKARLFVPKEAMADLEAFKDAIYEAFPVVGLPHTLVIKVGRAVPPHEG
jgi:hypothetical protein